MFLPANRMRLAILSLWFTILVVYFCSCTHSVYKRKHRTSTQLAEKHPSKLAVRKSKFGLKTPHYRFSRKHPKVSKLHKSKLKGYKPKGSKLTRPIKRHDGKRPSRLKHKQKNLNRKLESHAARKSANSLAQNQDSNVKLQEDT